jgi:hypothetical protein
MASDLLTAEQCVDRQVRTDQFRGREIELVTGQVLLHAVDRDGRPLCDCGPEELIPNGQEWDAGYLPHLARCGGCARLADPRVSGVVPGRAAPASDVDIRTAHETADEKAAVAALREVLGRYDLRRWLLTDLVFVDETVRGGYSHPLTLGSGPLISRPARALTTFLHEQLHWLEGPGTESAIVEASRRWPDPPGLSAGGGTDPRSTWLHLSVCALEYQSLAELLGPSAAAAELRQHTGYAWIYGQILAAPDWFSGFLRRHGLRVPEHPSIPQRYFGAAWWSAAR